MENNSFNQGNFQETKTSLFEQPVVNPVAQLASEVAEGAEGFDRLVMKQILAYELKESFYFSTNSKEDVSPFISSLVKITNRSPVGGYNMSLAVLTRAVAASEQEHARMQLLVDCWNDLQEYANRYGLNWEHIRAHILRLSQNKIYAIVKYLISLEG